MMSMDEGDNISINVRKIIHPDRVVIELEFVGADPKFCNQCAQDFLEEVHLSYAPKFVGGG
jgi:hypothetical protein